jgi:lipoyl(octanoyl) transferase
MTGIRTISYAIGENSTVHACIFLSSTTYLGYSSFMADIWRYIDDRHCPAAFNMALDEAISVALKNNASPPTLRLYGWEMPSVSIGYFQKISDIDTGYCLRNNIPVVRRLTGGRAILHGKELTYSFSVRTEGRFSKGLLDSYKKIGTALSLALSQTGISTEMNLSKLPAKSKSPGIRSKSPLCFQSTSYGEVTAGNKKIIGSAQKRWPGALLQQGSVPLVIDTYGLTRIFRLSCVRGADELPSGLEEIVPGTNVERLKESIRRSFEETFEVQLIPSSATKEEVSLAMQLEAQKYLSHAWTFGR